MASELIASGGLVTYEVKIEGNKIPDKYGVVSIQIEKYVNRISGAIIVINEITGADTQFEVSSSDNFIPGKAIVIDAGYNTKNKTIFKGIVIKQSLKIDANLGPILEVECKDAAIQMTVGRKNASYAKGADSDAITKVIGNYGGLTSNVASTTPSIPLLQQYYCSDWDFVLARAEVNGMLVSTINGKVSVFKPDANTESVLKLAYGNNLLSFSADLNSITQLGSVKASAWDPKTQKLITGEASSDLAGPGDITSKKLSDTIGLSDYLLQTTATEEKDDLTNWAKAQIIKSEYSKILGKASCQGTSLVEPGVYITMASMGTRFNGDHLVSSVRHEIEGGNWTTHIGLGLSPIWFTQGQSDVIAPPASGLLPGVQGLFNGTVKKSYDDPDNGFRVLVDLPLFDESGDGLWARLLNNYSTDGAGMFFYPEVGDEVIVGFLNDDPRYPVILGSVYSEKIKPFSDFTPDEKNTKKAIVTKSKLEIEFDDENKIITVTTPGKNSVVLDDKNKKILIKDQNDNSLEMSDSGIEFKSSKAITIESDKEISIKGKNGIKLESSGGDVEIKGSNIKQEADSAFSAKSSGTAKVQGGSELTLKGAMVKIN